MVVSKLFTLILYLVLKTSGQSRLPSEESCDCGVRKKATLGVRVIGGKEAVANEFPWAALLRIGKNGQFECGGSLINDRFVLTAAHCVPNPKGLDIEVILGAHDRTLSELTTLRLRAVSVSVHDQYAKDVKKGFVVYDFALIELKEPVNFSLYPHIRPICMPDPKFIEEQGDLFTTVGWGHTEVNHLVLGNLTEGVGSSPSDTLQKIDVRAVKLQTCQKTFSGLNIKIRNVNMCAKSNLGDTCQGDSGGGLVKKHINGRYYEIVGVVSFGVGCKSSFNGKTLPGVYARVSSVIKWIKSKTSSGNSCRRPTTTTTTTTATTEACSEWGEWTSFSKCTHTSGYGKKTRTKFRTGTECRGTKFNQEIICNQIDKTKMTTTTTQDCSEWGEWTSYSKCTHTSGYGKKTRTKFRTGTGCRGTKFNQEIICNQIDKTKITTATTTTTQACSQWGEWTSFSNCSHRTQTSGYGKKTRTKFRTGYGCRGTLFTQQKFCIL